MFFLLIFHPLNSTKQGKHTFFVKYNLRFSTKYDLTNFLYLAHHGRVSPSLVVTKVITVVETVIDGKVVESSKTVDVDVDEIES